jgi:protein O-GlcNAc transferase
MRITGVLPTVSRMFSYFLPIAPPAIPSELYLSRGDALLEPGSEKGVIVPDSRSGGGRRANLASVDDSDRQIERGLSLHRAGNALAAEQIYRGVLARLPNHPDANYLMGCVAHQRGDSAGAVPLLEKAIAASPERAEFHYALASAVARMDDLDRAEASLRRALALGGRAEFHTALGELLVRRRRLPEGIAELAFAAAAGDEDAHYHLGKAHLANAEPLVAIAPLELALKLRPADVPALAALRQALAAAGRSADADAALDEAAGGAAGDVTRLCDLADALQSAADFAGATALYQRALAPGSGQSAAVAYRAWFACGCAQLSDGDFASAIPSFTEALTVRSDSIEARHNLGRALYEMGQVSEACRAFATCAARKEKGSSLARAMLAVIAPGAPEFDNQAVLEARQAWVLDLRPGTLPPLTPKEGMRGEKLRIGYVSSFFHRDNWMKPVWGLINQHDRAAFEVRLYSDAPRSAIRYGYAVNEGDRFIDISRLSNKAVGELIREAGIQVLIDLNGFSEMGRLPLFLLRPAPVILGWFNLYATTGMPCFDGLVGDATVLPMDEEPFYSEKILRVPGSYLTFNVDYPVPPVAALPCIGGAPFTFGCLGSQYKFTPEVIAAWSRILQAAPESRLLLKNKALGHAAARAFVRAEFAQAGIAAGRLLLEGPEPHFDFLRAYDRVDLALDTFPYNGGTTTTEALWQGVPVIAFRGDRWAARTSASLLRAAGLTQFLVPTLEGYISMAARLAGTPAEWPVLVPLRAGMRERLAASAVCDTKSFARRMEQLYLEAWHS